MALVVDLGSRSTRAGWSGEDVPKLSVLSSSLIDMHLSSKANEQEDMAVDGEGEGSPSHFLERGLVTNWDQVEKLWGNLFSKFECSTEETPILFADSPSTKDQDREKMAEILFEKFSIPHYFVCNQTVLNLYSCGRTSGLMIDLGYGSTHAAAVHEGFAYPHIIERMEVGGLDIARSLESMLQDRGLPTAAIDMDRLQEEVAAVALDFVQDSQRLRAHPEEQPALTLPDGNTITLTDEHLRCGEALFQPGLVGAEGEGLDERLMRIIRVCDSDKDGGPLRALPQCILLCGGLSQLPGLVPRLRAEIFNHSSASRSFYMAALPGDDARNAAWLGGSILGSLPGFIANNFMSLGEYHEVGASAIHRKC